MRKLLLISTLLLFAAACGEKEEYRPDGFDNYYWSGGEKIPIQKMDDKFYVVFYSADEAKLKAELAKAGMELSRINEREDYSYLGLDMIGSGAKTFTDFKTATIEGGYEKTATVLSSALYCGPYYKTEHGSEIGMTELFAVMFKSGTDLAQLEKLAKENSVELIGRDTYDPNWYFLVCTNLSRGNSLEMANLFYESGLFEEATPDFIGGGRID